MISKFYWYLYVTSAHGNNYHSSDHVSERMFSFHAPEEGDYMACFFSSDHKSATTLTVDFEWKSGVIAKDWANVAKKGSIEAPQGQQEVQQRKILYMGLYLLIWGWKRDRQQKVNIILEYLGIAELNSINLKAATSAALLILPSKFSEEELYAKICGLSYMGDIQMLFAEDKNKTASIVSSSIQPLHIGEITARALHLSRGMEKLSGRVTYTVVL